MNSSSICYHFAMETRNQNQLEQNEKGIEIKTKI